MTEGLRDDNFDYAKYLLDQISRNYYVNFKKDNPVINESKVLTFVSYAMEKLKTIKEIL